MNNTNFAIAVKAFIIKDNSLLLIKRNKENVHKPCVWEVPGGRLNELSEDPIKGLEREVKEETGLDIIVKNPLSVHHFIRDDGQKITMINFLCQPTSSEITLSEEHTEFQWLPKEQIKSLLVSDFHEEIDIINKYFWK
jgi:8-oxo-dGTP diphosphatase